MTLPGKLDHLIREAVATGAYFDARGWLVTGGSRYGENFLTRRGVSLAKILINERLAR